MPLLKLGGMVSPSASIEPDDIVRTKQALGGLGHYPIPQPGITDFTDDKMFDAIKGFQREQGLKVDGLMSPSGPTARAINAALVEKVQRHGTSRKLRTGETSESLSPSSPGFADSIPSGSGQDSLAGGSSYYREPGLATPKAFGQAAKQLRGAVDHTVEQSAEAIERAAKVAETPAQGVFASLAREGINADLVRRKYVALVEKASRETEGKLERGVLSPQDAAR